MLFYYYMEMEMHLHNALFLTWSMVQLSNCFIYTFTTIHLFSLFNALFHLQHSNQGHLQHSNQGHLKTHGKTCTVTCVRVRDCCVVCTVFCILVLNCIIIFCIIILWRQQ